MSTEIYEGKLYVTRHAGPANEGPDRARWQVTIPEVRPVTGYFTAGSLGNDPYVTLRRAEVLALAGALAKSAR